MGPGTIAPEPPKRLDKFRVRILQACHLFKGEFSGTRGPFHPHQSFQEDKRSWAPFCFRHHTNHAEAEPREGGESSSGPALIPSFPVPSVKAGPLPPQSVADQDSHTAPCNAIPPRGSVRIWSLWCKLRFRP